MMIMMMLRMVMTTRMLLLMMMMIVLKQRVMHRVVVVALAYGVPRRRELIGFPEWPSVPGRLWVFAALCVCVAVYVCGAMKPPVAFGGRKRAACGRMKKSFAETFFSLCHRGNVAE